MLLVYLLNCTITSLSSFLQSRQTSLALWIQAEIHLVRAKYSERHIVLFFSIPTLKSRQVGTNQATLYYSDAQWLGFIEPGNLAALIDKGPLKLYFCVLTAFLTVFQIEMWTILHLHSNHHVTKGPRWWKRFNSLCATFICVSYWFSSMISDCKYCTISRTNRDASFVCFGTWWQIMVVKCLCLSYPLLSYAFVCMH